MNQKFRPTSVRASEAENDGNLYLPSSARACVASSAAAGGMLCSPLNIDLVQILKWESDNISDIDGTRESTQEGRE
jgi:hypothetical protein